MVTLNSSKWSSQSMAWQKIWFFSGDSSSKKPLVPLWLTPKIGYRVFYGFDWSFEYLEQIESRKLQQAGFYPNLSFFFKNGPFPASFLYFRLFYKQLTVNKCSIKVADDWIWTRVISYHKRPLCQLRHNHFPNLSFFEKHIKPFTLNGWCG